MLLGIGDIWNIPRKGNFDEICLHGIETKGVVESLDDAGDADDDHWTVRRFEYSHDGHTFHGVSYSMNGFWKSGDTVAVKYLGDQAVIPDDPPPDIDPTNDFLLVVVLFSTILSPVLVIFCVLWVLSSIWKAVKRKA